MRSLITSKKATGCALTAVEVLSSAGRVVHINFSISMTSFAVYVLLGFRRTALLI